MRQLTRKAITTLAAAICVIAACVAVFIFATASANSGQIVIGDYTVIFKDTSISEYEARSIGEAQLLNAMQIAVQNTASGEPAVDAVDLSIANRGPLTPGADNPVTVTASLDNGADEPEQKNFDVSVYVRPSTQQDDAKIKGRAKSDYGTHYDLYYTDEMTMTAEEVWEHQCNGTLDSAIASCMDVYVYDTTAHEEFYETFALVPDLSAVEPVQNASGYIVGVTFRISHHNFGSNIIHSEVIPFTLKVTPAPFHFDISYNSNISMSWGEFISYVQSASLEQAVSGRLGLTVTDTDTSQRIIDGVSVEADVDALSQMTTAGSATVGVTVGITHEKAAAGGESTFTHETSFDVTVNVIPYYPPIPSPSPSDSPSPSPSDSPSPSPSDSPSPSPSDSPSPSPSDSPPPSPSGSSNPSPDNSQAPPPSTPVSPNPPTPPDPVGPVEPVDPVTPDDPSQDPDEPSGKENNAKGWLSENAHILVYATAGFAAIGFAGVLIPDFMVLAWYSKKVRMRR